MPKLGLDDPIFSIASLGNDHFNVDTRLAYNDTVNNPILMFMERQVSCLDPRPNRIASTILEDGPPSTGGTNERYLFYI